MKILTINQIHEMTNLNLLKKYFKWLIINHDNNIEERPNKEELKKMIDARNIINNEKSGNKR